MNIAGWPYVITVDGDVEAGGAASVTIDLAAPMTPDAHVAMRYALESFVALAAAGGLGGDRIAPDRSTAALASTAPPAVGTRAVWSLTALSIDALGLVVLFDMLTMLVDGVRAVAVQAGGIGPRAAFSREDLPAMWPQVPFGLEDDRTGPNVELEVEFARTPAESETEIVMEALGVWLDCGSVQGYRDWSVPPDHGYLAPTEDPRFTLVGASVTALLHDSGALEGAYDILINMLVKVHASVPVRVLELV